MERKFTAYGFVSNFIEVNKRKPSVREWQDAGFNRAYYYSILKKYEEEFDKMVLGAKIK